MDIRVEIVRENEDGSADAVVHFDKEGLEVLVQWGLVAMIVKGIETYKTTPAIKKKKKKA